ncbi:methyl-CpG-binding domain-containing protein 5-like isoform X1 [Salvia hispanica]|uniref:methyl-CpG-binding domain-containing protein 5-like isoform X1 n=1 Tax=Salvia hispanica TaxID=49212 RepID=UPI002008F4F3|nr:methyl-CpG-binding domain-containing protein 5-like isoform X1 [Salvia hispanica]XP_047980435.1 methyl-CpG-binding domain-containing protein 5-like isoform X1 [Salvia hispanica]XP_047980436.1 methyl-CpG-binding domain-containing protein 5-like isoform X1 [Salvia hispanica]XP_047980437.1 methyl-CpG-binding domain-containing protein 5-like isoform X1 [Salvia hispanica]XP_047980438.1 methyl-CpG-binding domain-containing protein 5-like isoform X1 [Salvia hispanica]
MSEPQFPPNTEPAPTDPAPNHTPASVKLEPLPRFMPDRVYNPEPISYFIPDAEPAPRAARRRDREERPSWLPENWTFELRRRNSGATAGQTDRYYIEPTGKHRFRSKLEVLHFLETGSTRPKRKAPSATETTPSTTPASETQSRASAIRKKSEAVVSDNTQPPPHDVNSAQADNAQPI